MSKQNQARKIRRSKTTNELEETDESSVDANCHIGPEYQVSIPNYRGIDNINDDNEMAERADAIWCPSDDLSEVQLKVYIEAALDRHGFNEEQALALLKQHENQIDEALFYLGNYSPQPSKWSVHEKSLFEEAFVVQGKNFKKIHEMMPEKSVGSLINYYYSWKKTKLQKSVIDEFIEELRKNRKNNGSEDGSEEENVEENNISEAVTLEIIDADNVASKKKGFWNKGCIDNRLVAVEDNLESPE